MDAEAIQAETIARLVDLAIAATVRDVAPEDASAELCDAAAANPALLTAAATTARRLQADAGPTDYVDAAVALLDTARDAAHSRNIS